MIRIIFLLLVCASVSTHAQTNKTLLLDGKNSNMCIGMDTINERWSIEMWVKGDDNQWKENEVLIGGGEYSTINTADKFPVVLKNGHLYNTAGNVMAPTPLDAEWHHIAVTCGKKGTRLYVDGEMVAQSDVVSSILPGVIGADEKSETIFGGNIDEVRIWRTELSSKTIRNWMGHAITPSHPNFSTLKGYYPLDEDTDDYYTNWTGCGPLSFHIRNYRMNYKEPAPLTPTVINDNKHFNINTKKTYFNAIDIPSEWDAVQGDESDQILKLRIAVNGDGPNKLMLNNIILDLAATQSLSDIKNISIYATGNKAKSKERTLIATATPAKIIQFKTPYELKTGINYFLVTFNIADNAVIGNKVGGRVKTFSINGKNYTPKRDNNFYPKYVIHKTGDTNIVKCLQWNIWHGGVHLGTDGPKHIVDLLRKCDADIVTMQEAYGSQDRFAQELNYNLSTRSAKDNLALFTRYKMLPIGTRNGFKSNPAIITLPNGKNLFVLDCWLRYAYRPAYASEYGNLGMSTDKWTEEDKILSKADIIEIINNDMSAHFNLDSMPVIIGGDFNSGSHLDWTKEAAHLHYDYVNTHLPTSHFMLEQGYKDSFRELNPNEITHSGGTFAVIYGQLQHSRIDYIYYKGNKIKALHSKTIRTAEEIDYVWAGDHAAVFTIFEIE
ncbi:MAG: LamG-like jellyroll fold domain-containing protein [Marinifilaceae bacterium]